MARTYIPNGYHAVTPYLIASDGEKLIDFLKEVFLAKELVRQTTGGGGTHVELLVGDSRIMVGIGGDVATPLSGMYLVYVPEVDAAHARAVAAGAVSIEEPGDQPYGDRRAGVKDAFGNMWYMSSPLKKPSARRSKPAKRSKVRTTGRRRK